MQRRRFATLSVAIFVGIALGFSFPIHVYAQGTDGGRGNNPPDTPSTPSGPTLGHAWVSYAYSTSATDPDYPRWYERVKYYFDWDDGSGSWTGWVCPGESTWASHYWSSPGTYYVKAKAKDSKGAVSEEWSSSLEVKIWGIQTVDYAPHHMPPPNSIAVDSSGDPYILYENSHYNGIHYDSVLLLAEWTGTGWVMSSLATGCACVGHGTLAVDDNNNPHYIYSAANYNELSEYYASSGPSYWSPIEGCTTIPYGASLTLDSSDTPHVSYYHPEEEKLKYAKWIGGWSIDIVESNVGDWDDIITPSIAVDSAGTPYIAYYNKTNKDLMLARRIGPGPGDWDLEIVDPFETPPPDYYSAFVSLAIDSSNNPHIVYKETEGWTIKYTKKVNGVWENQTVDSRSYLYPGLSKLALDENNRPHVIYHSGVYGDTLWYAEKNGSDWVNLEIDTSTHTRSSIAIDGFGNPHISYSKNNHELKYATTS